MIYTTCCIAHHFDFQQKVQNVLEVWDFTSRRFLRKSFYGWIGNGMAQSCRLSTLGACLTLPSCHTKQDEHPGFVTCQQSHSVTLADVACHLQPVKKQIKASLPGTESAGSQAPHRLGFFL